MKRLTVLVIAIALAGCGVPTDEGPRTLDSSNVPFHLLAPTAEPTTTTVPGLFTATARITIYLADADGFLTATSREVAAPPSISRVITALLAGPSGEEADHLHSAITADTRLLEVKGPSDGLVTVDLSDDMLDITGRQQILALAQVVFTLTSLPSVDRVLFEFDGEPREVPNGDGKLTAAPLGRMSYRELTRRDR